MMKLALGFTSVMIAAGSGALLVRSPEPSRSSLPMTSVQVLDDRLRPVEGVPVQLTDGHGMSDSSGTDPDGQTWWMPLEPSSGAELVVADVETPHGTLLGFVETFASPQLDSSLDFSLWHEIRTAPLATPISIEGQPDASPNLGPSDGSHPHWTVVVPKQSELQFGARVATLMDGEAVSAYAAYRGFSIDPSEYVRGIVMLVPAVQLGDSGLMVSIKLHGDLEGETPTVDAYNIYVKRKQYPVGPPLAVEPITAIGGGADKAHVLVSGTVRKGHVVLLVRSSASGAGVAEYVQDEPRTVTIPAQPSAPQTVQAGETEGGYLSPSALARVSSDPALSSLTTDCEPPVPTQPAAWSCTGVTPASHCPVTEGDTACTTVRSRSPRWCREGGSTVSSQKGVTQRMKVTLNFKGKSGATETGGGFEYGIESTTVQTDIWTAGAGTHGLGQCMRYFRFELVCGTRWHTFEDETFYGPFGLTAEVHPCVRAVTETTVCTDLADSQMSCDRTQ